MKEIPFELGAVLVVDKPLNWTSFDVVKKIRYTICKQFNLKKIKVGHAGTLDPLASGVVIVCTGKKTKIIDQFINESKEYTGEIRLGSTTPSFDLETEINKEFPLPALDDNILKKISNNFWMRVNNNYNILGYLFSELDWIKLHVSVVVKYPVAYVPINYKTLDESRPFVEEVM